MGEENQADLLPYQFNCIMAPDTYIKCAEIVHQLGGNQMVESILPEPMPWDRNLPHGVKWGHSELQWDMLSSL